MLNLTEEKFVRIETFVITLNSSWISVSPFTSLNAVKEKSTLATRATENKRLIFLSVKTLNYPRPTANKS